VLRQLRRETELQAVAVTAKAIRNALGGGSWLTAVRRPSRRFTSNLASLQSVAHPLTQHIGTHTQAEALTKCTMRCTDLNHLDQSLK
jgi:hypothetical protein